MTLYAVRPDPDTGSLDDAEVVDQLKDGWAFLEQAITVWRLVDDSRANEIESLKDRASLAAGDGEIRFHTADLQELVRLLSDVDHAIITAGIVDSHWRVPAERLEELAKRVPAMDLVTERSLQSKSSALGEVMINAVSVRNFLSNAADAGCIVVLG
jgi:ATP phosphoribosyltransferase